MLSLEPLIGLPSLTPGRRSKPVPDVTTAAPLHQSLRVRSSFHCQGVHHRVYRLRPWPCPGLPRPPHNDSLIRSLSHPPRNTISQKWAIIRKNTSVSFLWDRVWNAVEAFIAFFEWELRKQAHSKLFETIIIRPSRWGKRKCCELSIQAVSCVNSKVGPGFIFHP